MFSQARKATAQAHPPYRRKLWLLAKIPILLGSSFSSILLLLLATTTLWAAPTQQIATVRTNSLQGELPYQYTAHYLGLEGNLRDSLINLTLAYDPQNNPNLKGFVNFMVLDEDGLRRFLAGANPNDLAVAGGSPVQFDPIGNKMGVAFRASGHGHYTVIVYNNSLLPVHYTLTVEGGMLIDNANQTLNAVTAGGAPTADELAQNDATATEQDANTSSERLPNPLGSAAGPRLTGSLDTSIGRHYLAVAPAIRDGSILFNFHYDPLDQPTLLGNVNFWILDEAGLNAIVRGEKPGDVNLATGFPAPFSPFPNDLQASFNASGKKPYTVVIFNQTAIPATYEIVADGGILSDRFGQTNEAKAAAPLTTDASTAASPVETPDNNSATADTTTELAAEPFGVAELAGTFHQAYQHHYLALAPTLRDGEITLTMDFDPKDSQILRENINFMVLTEEGLQAVINGAPPAAHDIAMGAFVPFGLDKGKLSAAFNASGRGHYTVIVFNNSAIPAHYLLHADGGLLATEDVNVTLP
ncbi:MAG: hypothetical protein R3C14_37725 [Caldilineaceae bacterium]